MAEKNLFIDIFLRLGLEPYIFVLIQKLARLHPKVVVSGLHLHKTFKNNNRLMKLSGIVYSYLDFTFSG